MSQRRLFTQEIFQFKRNLWAKTTWVSPHKYLTILYHTLLLFKIKFFYQEPYMHDDKPTL